MGEAYNWVVSICLNCFHISRFITSSATFARDRARARPDSKNDHRYAIGRVRQHHGRLALHSRGFIPLYLRQRPENERVGMKFIYFRGSSDIWDLKAGFIKVDFSV